MRVCVCIPDRTGDDGRVLRPFGPGLPVHAPQVNKMI